MRKLVTVIAVLLVVGVVGLFVFSKVIGSGIKAGVETFGPEVTQTPITLDSVVLSAFSGSGSIEGLVVGNPEGFSTPHAIKLDGFSLKLEPMSVLSDKIVINEIVIEGPEFIFESGVGLGKSNIGTILANIETFTGESEPTKDAGPSKKVQIDLLRITGGQVKVSNKLLRGQSLYVPLPNIELVGIGANENGSTFGETMKLVFQAINQGIIASLSQSGKVVGDQLKTLGEGTQKGLGGLLNSLRRKAEEEE